jgi:integrase/recombinase XerD
MLSDPKIKKFKQPLLQNNIINIPSTMKELEQQFLNYLRQLGYSKDTQSMSKSAVKEFVSFAKTTEFQRIQTSDLRDFYAYLQERPLQRKVGILSDSMVRHIMYSLKLFFNWLETTQQIIHNPISSLELKKAKVNERQPLKKEEVKALFNATKNLKETAILHLFYSCGLRRSEAVLLNIEDVHFTNNLLYVREGKGAKRRVIPLTDKVKTDLELYVEHERKETDNQAFMINERGLKMSGDSYNNALKKIVLNSGQTVKCSLHHLRHSIATHLLDNGLSFEHVREFLGHTFLETTQIYAKLNNKKLFNLQ